MPEAPSKGIVWVVDDSPQDRELLAYYLKRAGFDVKEFRDGTEVLEALKTEAKPTAIVTDRKMLQLGGVEMAAEIRGAEAPYKNTPILLLSDPQGWAAEEITKKIGISYISKDGVNEKSDTPPNAGKTKLIAALEKEILERSTQKTL